MKNLSTLLSVQFSPVTAAKGIFKNIIPGQSYLSIFVTRTFEKSPTERNAILWFFGGLLTIKTTFQYI